MDNFIWQVNFNHSKIKPGYIIKYHEINDIFANTSLIIKDKKIKVNFSSKLDNIINDIKTNHVIVIYGDIPITNNSSVNFGLQYGIINEEVKKYLLKNNYQFKNKICNVKFRIYTSDMSDELLGDLMSYQLTSIWPELGGNE